MTLAIFDLDNTLLRGDSDHAWGEYLMAHGRVEGEAFRRANDHYYALYQQGRLDIYDFLENHQLKILSRFERGALETWRAEFMLERIAPLICPDACALVEKHRTAGHTLVIITATNRFLTEPIAAAFGVPHLIATEPEEIDGRYTGKVAGSPCYREGKITRLRAWLPCVSETLEGSWFYSDSHNDLPLLSLVSHPVAVNPDPELTQHAARQGWPQIQLAGKQ